MLEAHIRSAWHYRYFIVSAIRGEMRTRFVNSRIGSLWFVLHPLAMAAIYALVLSKVLGAKLANVEGDLAYAVFLISGIAVWSFFQEITLRCMTIFIEYANTLKKISFPRIALPVIVLGSALVSHAFLLVAVVAVFLLLGQTIGFVWLALPLGIVVAAGLGLGLGIGLGVLNVFSRDVQQVMSVVFNLWFWLTPIVYPISIVPDELRFLVQFNPATNLVSYYQDIMLYQIWPDPGQLIYPAAVAVILMGVSLFVFRRANTEIMDVL